MIPEIADSSMGQIELGMINAIAFNSKWDEKYKEADVLKGKFHNCDGTISTVKMLKSEETSYLEDEFFIGFTKKFYGNEYSYVALLPKKKTS